MAADGADFLAADVAGSGIVAIEHMAPIAEHVDPATAAKGGRQAFGNGEQMFPGRLAVHQFAGAQAPQMRAPFGRSGAVFLLSLLIGGGEIEVAVLRLDEFGVDLDLALTRLELPGCSQGGQHVTTVRDLAGGGVVFHHMSGMMIFPRGYAEPDMPAVIAAAGAPDGMGVREGRDGDLLHGWRRQGRGLRLGGFPCGDGAGQNSAQKLPAAEA